MPELYVATQNVLLDHTRTKAGLILAQNERIDSIAATFAGFPERFDVVGIQEAHRQRNGEILAETLGYEKGFWENHNQKPYPESPSGRPNEFVGLFGEQVDHATVIELGDNRRALMTVIADVAFLTMHLRAGASLSARSLRFDQTLAITDALEPYVNAVAFGDFNEPPIRVIAKGRGAMKKAEFESVFPLTGQLHPVTHPSEPYREIFGSGNKLSLDDIQIRGPRVRALAAGVLKRTVIDDETQTEPGAPPRAGSDHDGLWARLEITPVA